MTTCWCGNEYVRGVCPIHGLMRDPRINEGGTTIVNEAGEAATELPLTTMSSALSVAVTMTAGTWRDGPSLALSTGKWLIDFDVCFSRTATTLDRYHARITDKTTHYASAIATHPSLNPHFVQLHMMTILALTSETTIFGQGMATTGGASSTMRAAMDNATYGPSPTVLTAVKIG